MADQRTRFVAWWYRSLQVGVFAFAALLLLSMIMSGGNNGAALFAALVLLLVLGLVVRAARSSSIELRNDEVVITGLIRTRRVDWSQVRTVEVTRGSSAAFVPWRVPCFELADGSTVVADEIRSLRTPSIVDEVVAEARRRLQAGNANP